MHNFNLGIFRLLLFISINLSFSLLQAQTYLQSSTSFYAEENPGMLLFEGVTITDFEVADGVTHLLYYYHGENKIPTTDGTTTPNKTEGFLTEISRSVGYAQLDADGNILYHTIIAGANNDLATEIEVSDGVVYILGEANSSDFPTTDGTGPTSSGGFTNSGLFLMSRDAASGGLLASTIISSDLSLRSTTWGTLLKAVNGEAHLIYSNINDSQINPSLTPTDGSSYPSATGASGTWYYKFGPSLAGPSVSFQEGFTDIEDFEVVGNTVHLVGMMNNAGTPTEGGSNTPGSNNELTAAYGQYDMSTATWKTKFIGVDGFAEGGDIDVVGNTVHIGKALSSNGPVTPTSTGLSLTHPDASFNGIYYTQLDIGTAGFPAIVSTVVGTDGRTKYGEMEVVNGKAHFIYSFESNNDLLVPTTDGTSVASTTYSTGYTALNNFGDVEIFTILGAGTASDELELEVQGDNVYLYSITGDVSNYPHTNYFPTGANDPTPALSKINHTTGELMFSTTFGSNENESLRSKNDNLLQVVDGLIYMMVQFEGSEYPQTSNVVPTSSTGTVNSKSGNITVINMCDDNLTYTTESSTLTPATQTVCQLALVENIMAEDVYVAGDDLPELYIEGAPVNQYMIKANYQWQWSESPTGPWMDIDGATLMDYTPIPASTDRYFKRVSTKDRCCGLTPLQETDVAAVLVNDDEAPTVDAGGVFHSCAGLSVTLGGAPTADGGTPPYTYTWDGVSSSDPNPVVSPSTSTIYTVTVVDATGCSQIDQVPVNIYQANAGANRSSCSGEPIRIGSDPPAGLSGVTYSWSPTTGLDCPTCPKPVATPSATTTYTVSMTIPTTGGSCTTTDDVTITYVGPPGAGAFAGADRTICIGGTTTIGNNLDASYDYTWAPGNYLTDNQSSQTTFQSGSLELPEPDPITYYLTAEKAGCTFIDDATVNVILADAGQDGCGPRYVGIEDPHPDIDATYSWVKVSGPGNFTGATNEPRVPVSSSGSGTTTYRLTVTHDGVSCTDEVVVPPCGCVVEIDVIAEYGCPVYDLRGELQPPPVVLIATAADIFSGNPDDFEYSWSPQAGLSAYDERIVTLTDGVNRTYTVTMSSPFEPSFSCSETIVVNHPAWSLPNYNAQDRATCLGNPVQIGSPPVAAYSYNWSGGSLNDDSTPQPNVTPLSDTEYAVTVTDTGSGCIALDTVIVTVEGASANPGPDHLVCDNGIVQLGGGPAQPGYTYSWSPSSAPWQNGTNSSSAQPEVQVAINTTFTLTATHTATGCQATDQVDIVVGTPVPPFNLPEQTFCPSDNAVSIGSGAPSGQSNYQWEPSTLVDNPNSANTTITPPPSGSITLSLEVGNSSGCNRVETLDLVTEETEPDPGESQVICVGQSITMGGDNDPAATYQWSPGTGLSATGSANPTLTPSSAGTTVYTLSKTLNGCTVSSDVTITVEDFDIPNLENKTVCKGGCAQIGFLPEPNVRYSWYPTENLSDPKISNPIACDTVGTVYTLTAVGLGGCAVSKSMTFSISPEEPPMLEVPPVSFCLGAGNLQFAPVVTPSNGNYYYEWSPDDVWLYDPTDPNTEIGVSEAGSNSYTLTVTSLDNGCSTSAEAEYYAEVCRVCEPPTALPPVASPGECPDPPDPDNATIRLSGVTGDKVGIVMGGPYDDVGGPLYPSALSMGGADTITLTGLVHDTIYTIRVFNFANSCFYDIDSVRTAQSVCCPDVENPSASQEICADEDLEDIFVTTTASEIDFVYFTSPALGDAMYSGGTSLGIVSPAANDIATLSGASFPGPGTYYVYTIVHPTPSQADCRPYQSLEITINPLPDNTLEVTDTLVCENGNALICVLNSETGIAYELEQDWTGSIVDGPVAGNGADACLRTGIMGTVGTFNHNVIATNPNTGCVDTLLDQGIIEVDYCDYPLEVRIPCPEDNPCHFVNTNLYLGAGISADPDPDGVTDDNEGFLYPNDLHPGNLIHIRVIAFNTTGSDARLRGWIDWNNDNDFDDAGELIEDNIYASGTYNGSYTLSIPVTIPNDVAQDIDLNILWRYSTDLTTPLGPCEGSGACAADGEVEYHTFRVSCKDDQCVGLEQIQRN